MLDKEMFKYLISPDNGDTVLDIVLAQLVNLYERMVETVEQGEILLDASQKGREACGELIKEIKGILPILKSSLDLQQEMLSHIVLLIEKSREDHRVIVELLRLGGRMSDKQAQITDDLLKILSSQDVNLHVGSEIGHISSEGDVLLSELHEK